MAFPKSFPVGGLPSTRLKIKQLSSAYTIVADDIGTTFDCVSGTFTISLAAAVSLGDGFYFYVINNSTGSITIDPNENELINGSYTFVIGRTGGVVKVLCNGTKFIIGNVGTHGLLATSGSSTINAIAYGDSSVALGSGAVASFGGYSGSLALGKGATSPFNYASAIGANSGGQGSNAIAGGAMALGGSYASGVDSFAAAIGSNSSSYGALGNNSIAMGYLSKASGSSGISIGYSTTSNNAAGYNAIAIGNNASSTGIIGSTIAIGCNVTAASPSGGDAASIAIGTAGQMVGAALSASKNGSIAIGTNCISSADFSVSLGFMTRANAATSYSFGHRSQTLVEGQFAYASGAWASYPTVMGEAQMSFLVLRKETTTATPDILTTNGAAPGSNNQLILSNDSSYTFTGSVIARNTATDTESKAWTFYGAIRRGASSATTTFIGTPSVNIVGADTGTSSWSISLTTDTSNGGMSVNVTGEAAKTIRWVCRIDTVEVIG